MRVIFFIMMLLRKIYLDNKLPFEYSFKTGLAICLKRLVAFCIIAALNLIVSLFIIFYYSFWFFNHSNQIYNQMDH